jgi:glycosyltransferase involved in cell wall biosynthesis
MNILVNLATLKKGGGQNVGLNFIYSIFNINYPNCNFYFVVVEHSEIHKTLAKYGVSNISFMPSNPIKRMVKEFLFGNKILKGYKIDIIYSYFGYGLYSKKYPQISGSADSNLFFPEIDFWKHYSGFKLVVKNLIDRYRIWGLKNATAVIFENEAMQKRGIKLFNLKNTIFIKPSVSEIKDITEFKLPTSIQAQKKGLFFCGWQKNKNYLLIPEIAAELKRNKIDFHFVFTAPPNQSVEHLEFLELIKKLNVEDMISIIGSINKSQIPSLYASVDYVFLLSKLESFSNNIIESWFYKKLLIVANEDWAKSIFRDAAFYVDIDSAKSVSKKLLTLLNNEELYQKIISEGNYELSKYPTIHEKTKQELDYIKTIYETNY